jgi:phenylpropionate dioxygenase-like ring-hydroxylating dioxygenase large terminal subunit
MEFEGPLFLKNLWYLALPGKELKKNELLAKEILSETIVFGRDENNLPFALKDNCAHRGMPLSLGHFDGKTLQCCYHGWEFDCKGTCKNIPALANREMNFSNVKVPSYPCKEINGTVWVYIPHNKTKSEDTTAYEPDLLLANDKVFRHVSRAILPCNIDHSAIGLIDPAHVALVHQSWFWQSSKIRRMKEKQFAPSRMGFKMVRHKPSSNYKGYSLLKGGVSTEIDFQIPGIRIEHIQVGTNEIISFTTLTPVNDNSTELNHFFYTSLKFVKLLWWPLKQLGKKFVKQDLNAFTKLSQGLKTNPRLMLLGEPDAQAHWYYELKKQWQKAQENGVPFENTLKAQTLRWFT